MRQECFCCARPACGVTMAVCLDGGSFSAHLCCAKQHSLLEQELTEPSLGAGSSCRQGTAPNQCGPSTMLRWCWGPQHHAVCGALLLSQNRLKCPLSVVVRHLMGTGPECLRTCQVSCRLGGRSSFIIAFLQIMGVTAYFAQGCAGSFYGRVGDHGVQILGVPYP